MSKTAYLEIVEWEGNIHCDYLTDGETGYRIAGGKPWGGGRTVARLKVDVKGIIDEIGQYDKNQRAPH